MTTERIIRIDFDDSVAGGSPAQAEERAVAVHDLLESNSFSDIRAQQAGLGGPYAVSLQLVENRLLFDLSHEDGEARSKVLLSITPFRRVIKDYRDILQSYYAAIGTGQAAKIEAIDMARRGLHNEASELLTERLEGKIALDQETARRFITLICALDI